MAFVKYAKSAVVKPAITFDGWDAVRGRATKTSLTEAFNSRKASKVVLEKYDPQKYLLSHCTIIASVDTEGVKSPLGRQIVDGFQIERKYADWHITPQTLKYINNNNDCWERKLLLNAFHTFTGGENYVEHIQIPELSKGKIIDSAARDIGDSIYVDILVATDRKHAPLVQAIANGQLKTLSMGCQVQFTICTKCGNVAYDETQLCPHIKYLKGNDFYDEFGQKRKIAELCGHINEEPGSVRFIEASWVANPAFKGAVLRNILTPQDIKNVNQKIQVAFSAPSRTAESSAMQKAARLAVPANIRQLLAQDDGGMGDDPSQAAPPAAPKKDDAIHKLVDDLAGALREEAVKKIRGEISQTDSNRVNLDENRENESIIKSALQHSEWQGLARAVVAQTRSTTVAKKVLLGMILYKAGGWARLAKHGGFSGRELLAISRTMDLLTKRTIKAGESKIYRTVLAVNGMVPYRDIEAYLTACRNVFGRNLTSEETAALIDKGRLFDLGS
jgi:hypothetical protein